MCPLESKLNELKQKFLKECQLDKDEEARKSALNDPDLV